MRDGDTCLRGLELAGVHLGRLGDWIASDYYDCYYYYNNYYGYHYDYTTWIASDSTCLEIREWGKWSPQYGIKITQLELAVAPESKGGVQI